MLKLVLCGALALMSTSLIHAASCIVSGSVERPCVSEAHATISTVEARVTDAGFSVLPRLDARIGSEEFSALPEFNSSKPTGFTLNIR